MAKNKKRNLPRPGVFDRMLLSIMGPPDVGDRPGEYGHRPAEPVSALLSALASTGQPWLLALAGTAVNKDIANQAAALKTVIRSP